MMVIRLSSGITQGKILFHSFILATKFMNVIEGRIGKLKSNKRKRKQD